MNTPPRRVALTGATGFVGQALAHRFADAGYHVRALVRSRSVDKPLRHVAERIVGELDDPTSLDELLADAPLFVHCAGAVRGAREADFMRTNADPLAGIARAADRAGVGRLVLVSSLAAREPALSPYAQSKRAGETALFESARHTPCLALRPPAVYGPGDREMLPLFKAMRAGFAPVWGDPGARFSLIYIDDLARAVLACLQLFTDATGVFELHDGRPDGYCMDDIIEAVERERRASVRRVRIPARMLDMLARTNLELARRLGYAPMLTPWKLRELRHPRWVCDNTAFGDLTGWRPEILLSQGLSLTLP